MKFLKLIPTAIASIALSTHAFAQAEQAEPNENRLNLSETYDLARPDGHAPIGVMGDHVHREGEWMFSYRYMYMDMGQNYDGDSEVSANSVLSQGFLVTPTDMTMEMHMFGVMYALTDEATVMFGLPYIIKDMNHQIGGPAAFPLRGQTFNTRTEGVGDAKLTLLYKIWEGNRQNLIFNAGVSLPTGSIDERDNIPLPPPNGSNPVLPYPMQLGSGSFGIMPGFTYNGQTDWLSWGGQALGTLWLNDNSADYRLGDSFLGTAWVAKPWTDWVSTSFRLAYNLWGNIDGADARIGQNAPVPGFRSVPTAQPDLRGGQRLDVLFGANFDLPVPDSWPIGSNRLAVEGGFPAYQKLDGPQLGVDWQITAGWQMSW